MKPKRANPPDISVNVTNIGDLVKALYLANFTINGVLVIEAQGCHPRRQQHLSHSGVHLSSLEDSRRNYTVEI
jgi:hypothetical protein